MKRRARQVFDQKPTVLHEHVWLPASGRATSQQAILVWLRPSVGGVAFLDHITPLPPRERPPT